MINFMTKEGIPVFVVEDVGATMAFAEPKKIHPEGEPYVYCEDCGYFREEVIKIWGAVRKRDYFCEHPENLKKQDTDPIIDPIRKNPGYFHKNDPCKINEDNACKWFKG